MIIRPGRALLGINEADCTSCSYIQGLMEGTLTAKEISVRTGANALLSGVVAAASAIALLAF